MSHRRHMPPTIEIPPCPTDHSVKAMDWLRYHGVTFATPPIRSSDLGNCLHDPFAYFLSRRLGIQPALSYSVALSRGSWTHAHFQRMRDPVELRNHEIGELLQRRIAEIDAACDRLSITGDKRQGIIDIEIDDERFGRCLWDVASEIPFGRNGDRRTLKDRLLAKHWRELSREVCYRCRLQVSVNGGSTHVEHPIVIQPDLLLHHEIQNTIWIVDLKTTTGSCLERLAECPGAFQTSLYCAVIRRLLETECLQQIHGLPKDVQFGGMMHIAVSKPQIRFGQNDRDFILNTEPLKSGPRKGQPRNEKEYVGEPRIDNYLARVRRWMLGIDEYSDKAPERELDPCVNISYTQGFALDTPQSNVAFQARLNHVARFARSPIDPLLFPKGEYRNGEKCSYGPFASSPISVWPSLIASDYLLARREDSATILGEP